MECSAVSIPLRSFVLCAVLWQGYTMPSKSNFLSSNVPLNGYNFLFTSFSLIQFQKHLWRQHGALYIKAFFCNKRVGRANGSLFSLHIFKIYFLLLIVLGLALYWYVSSNTMHCYSCKNLSGCPLSRHILPSPPMLSANIMFHIGVGTIYL